MTLGTGKTVNLRGQLDAYALSLATTGTPKNTGTYWYVDNDAGNDENDGLTPNTAFRRISSAIINMSPNDVIVVKSGVYDEPDLILSKDYCEIFFDLGVVLAPAAGLTTFILAGDYCCLSGNLTINPPVGKEGLSVTGNNCIAQNVSVTNGATGIKVTGQGNSILNCGANYQTTIGFDIRGSGSKLMLCNTVGSGTATRGYKINSGADAGILRSCTSSNHASNGFYINTGSQDWHLIDCSSGVGDGPYYDADLLSAPTNFRFDDMIYHETTFNGSGPGSDNLFKITGAVEILYIYADVEVQLSADIGDIYLDAYDGTNQVDITNSPGDNVDSFDVGGLLIRTENVTSPITVVNSDQISMIENANFRKPRTSFILNQKRGVDNYIRLVYSGAATSGLIHWHCSWQPLPEGGLVEAV